MDTHARTRPTTDIDPILQRDLDVRALRVALWLAMLHAHRLHLDDLADRLVRDVAAVDALDEAA